MRCRGRAVGFVFASILFIHTISLCVGASEPSGLTDYGQAAVNNVLRVNSQCWIICDIADWPAIIGKEMPVQIRGLDPQQSFDLPTRQFILETLTNALTQLRQQLTPTNPPSRKSC